jgi:hypothetical protein
VQAVTIQTAAPSFDGPGVIQIVEALHVARHSVAKTHRANI